jgi:carbamoyltransferase
MQVSDLRPQRLSPFLGPSFDPDQIKAVLDNCKLRYDWLGEGTLIDVAVRHLREGRLVAWFEGRMEWGPRALGARSILASPFAPFVLENLNHFLKRRESWRGFALSTLADEAPAHFSGPAEAPFMECDYRPLEPARFRHVLPSEGAHVRMHTVTDDAPPRFRAVLRAFGRASGVGCLVNTSFNGFHEPIVCSPRDAIRVFFGSGLDVLILDQFVVSK